MRRRPLASIFAVILLEAACGARTGLLDWTAAPAPDGGGGQGGAGGFDAGEEDAGEEDAGLDVVDAPPDVPVVNCVEAGITYIYLLSEDNSLLSFYPPDGSFQTIGTIVCPAPPGDLPYSMAVDREGIAYTLFSDGELFRVDTATAACTSIGFPPVPAGENYYGMGFSADVGDPGETLYVAHVERDGGAPGTGLASIDIQLQTVTFVGPFMPPLAASGMELTGTGDGRLFGYALDPSGCGGEVVQLDTSSGAILSTTPLAAGGVDSALAFAYWGGDFYIFTTDADDGSTVVTRYDPADGSQIQVASITSTIIVGAGVSTCAPE
jgi:hypothetical protein